MPSIWWIRSDLRLRDNQALEAALETGGEVIPVFILDPRLLNSPYAGEKRLAFLFAGLQVLKEDLSARGGRLIIRQGDPLEELRRLMQESRVQVIFAEPDYSPFARSRDRRCEMELPIQWVGGPCVQPPGSVLKGDGKPYVVYTPFSRTWKSLPQPSPQEASSAPIRISTPAHLESLPIPEQPQPPDNPVFPPGEAEAQRRLASFLAEKDGLDTYAKSRDRVDLEGTSRLSPYLRFGMLSPRQAVASAYRAISTARDHEARKSAETWLNELIWREFYLHILYHFPRVRRENFRLPDIRWENDRAGLQAWQEGCTGYPIVDAAMRQLARTGWMHNRARMISASFLTKDLLIDWQEGERWFMQHLIDGNPAANNGGWQWVAGTGTDAAPYFRIFNPVQQSRKHDPQGAYIRRWLPELRRVPDRFIHTPWEMPAAIQQEAGCLVGRNYPAPFVEHAWAKERALQRYRA